MTTEQWHQVDVARPVDGYDAVYLDGHRAKLESLASELQDLEIIHLNSTAMGGGVAEILTGFIPLSEWHGLDTRWLVLPPSPSFFVVTRKIHDLLQGAPGELTPEEWETYVAHLVAVAGALPRDDRKRVWFVHDHQLLPLVELLPAGDKKVWVSHVDTSRPNPTIFERLLPFIRQFDHVVFSMAEYVPSELSQDGISICPPAIDPTRAKNHLMPRSEARYYVRDFGIDIDRPLLAQISRFDPWKDPIGVIDAYRLVKQSDQSVQLAMVGALSAIDDAKALETLELVKSHAGEDPDIHIYWDPSTIDDPFVRAFQTAPEVVIQKSLREGFGLTVTEAMWKGQAVIGGRVGGILHQIEDGASGYLVSSVEECAQRSLELLRDADLRARLGAAARESVREHSLLPRLMYDYLRLVA